MVLHKQWNGQDWVMFQTKQPGLTCSADCPGYVEATASAPPEEKKPE